MFKGFRNQLFYKNTTNKTVSQIPAIVKCSKCRKLNTVISSNSGAIVCCFCGQPLYIVKPN